MCVCRVKRLKGVVSKTSAGVSRASGSLGTTQRRYCGERDQRGQRGVAPDWVFPLRSSRRRFRELPHDIPNPTIIPKKTMSCTWKSRVIFL